MEKFKKILEEVEKQKENAIINEYKIPTYEELKEKFFNENPLTEDRLKDLLFEFHKKIEILFSYQKWD